MNHRRCCQTLCVGAATAFLAGCTVLRQAQDATPPIGAPNTDGFSSRAHGVDALLPPGKHGAGPSGHISNVIVIIQENRSFENFFAGYPDANAPMYGCANIGRLRTNADRGRDTNDSRCPRGDTVIDLTSTTFRKNHDTKHDWKSSMAEWNNGKMDGFWHYGAKDGAYLTYQYIQQSQIRPYWDMAQQYVLADAMFPTEFGGSFTGHLTLVAGTDNLSPTKAEVDFPNGIYDDCDSPSGTRSSYIDTTRKVHLFEGPFPCFDQWNTISKNLDSAGISWKYYARSVLDAGFWEPFEAMKDVRYGRDWKKHIIAPQTQVLNDAAKGNLASVSWVSPSRNDSDHPAYHSDTGPSWVASVVNAIGESRYWKGSAIIVVWDDWGGWYDNAPPPQLDFRGLGMRVPCLIISPYAKQNHVTHTQLEFASILKFIEEVNNLGSIGQGSQGYSDKRANDLRDAFDFNRKPRPFTPIGSKYTRDYFLHEPPSYGPLDTE